MNIFLLTLGMMKEDIAGSSRGTGALIRRNCRKYNDNWSRRFKFPLSWNRAFWTKHPKLLCKNCTYLKVVLWIIRGIEP